MSEYTTKILSCELNKYGISPLINTPKPEKCQFCGKDLYYYALVKTDSKAIFTWSLTPEKCNCVEAVKYNEEMRKKKEKAKRQEAERIQRIGHDMKVSGLREKSGINERYKQLKFEDFQTNKDNIKQYNLCLKYAKALVNGQINKNKNSLYLYGKSGLGKTHLATTIANELIDNEKSVIFDTVQDMLAKIRKTFNNSGYSIEYNTVVNEEYITNIYKDVDILVLDDIGSEQVTLWSIQKLFEIVNHRYERCKPNIITSNYSINNLLNVFSKCDKDNKNAIKIVDRLIEICTTINFVGESYRRR